MFTHNQGVALSSELDPSSDVTLLEGWLLPVPIVRCAGQVCVRNLLSADFESCPCGVSVMDSLRKLESKLPVHMLH